MGHKKFSEIVDTDMSVERLQRIEAIKAEARAEEVAFSLAELRRNRQLTQTELAQALRRTQASVSAMELADDNLLSTWRSAIEAMGGQLELVAVFDGERIALPLDQLDPVNKRYLDVAKELEEQFLSENYGEIVDADG